MAGSSAFTMIKSLKENKKLLKAVGYFKTMSDHPFKRSREPLTFKKASRADWMALQLKLERKKQRMKRINTIALILGIIVTVSFLIYIN